MKTILAYGDSLTYGANPTGGPRHDYHDRWPSVLEAGLGGQARVIAEGLGGRTTMFDDHAAMPDRNGVRILPTLLGSHAPLDLVIFMLGTNDLKPLICGNALEASFGVRRLVQVTRSYFGGLSEAAPQILVVSPPQICATSHTFMGEHFGDDLGIGQSKLLSAAYQARAEEAGVAFFDAATVAKADPLDGVHLDAHNTRAIGQGLVPLVSTLLGLKTGQL